MRRRVLKLFLLLSGFLFITACSDNINIKETGSSTEDFIGKTYKQTSDGIEFEVFLDKEEYVIGDNITVTASAKNVTGEDLEVWAYTNEFGKNGALQISTYIDGEEDYISNSMDYISLGDEYKGVLENRESIRCSIIFYTDTVVELTAEDYIELCVYLCVVNDEGEHDTVSIMIPVEIAFD